MDEADEGFGGAVAAEHDALKGMKHAVQACLVFHEHTLVAVEQVEQGNAGQVVEAFAIDGLVLVPQVEHVAWIWCVAPQFMVVERIDGNNLQQSAVDVVVDDLCGVEAVL